MTTELASPDPDALVAMMDKVQQCFTSNPSQWADDLPFLFDKLRSLSFGLGAPVHERISFTQEEIAALSGLMDKVRVPFASLEASGLLANPWSAASLRRDEVRNASVLRWFLDPNGGHGCGDALLTYVLGRVGPKLDNLFPAKPSARCTVAVEECPDGDRASRVDI